MALLTMAEAAMRCSFSAELIERLTRSCPKRDEERALPFKNVDGAILIDEREFDAYCRYLREPWPFPPKGKRPTIPPYIREDVRSESHHECAICGSMDNGEIAHIDGVAMSLSNSPDDLILLCPRHHTKYDLDFAPASNVAKDVVLAAKKMKRAARRRMLRSEGNAAAAL